MASAAQSRMNYSKPHSKELLENCDTDHPDGRDTEVWGSIDFFNRAQDSTIRYAGAKVDGMSGTIGLEASLNETTRGGLAITAMQGNGKDNNDITSKFVDSVGFGVMAYFNRQNNNIYTSGSISASQVRHENTRYLSRFGQTLTSEFDTTTIGGQLNLGYAIPIDYGMRIIPEVGANIQWTSREAYSEEGGSAALDVSKDDHWSILAHVGGKLEMDIQSGSKFIAAADIHMRVEQELVQNAIDINAEFQAGGPKFKNTGVQRDNPRLNLGLGWRFMDTNWIQGSLGFDMYFDRDGTEQRGSTRLKIPF